VNGSPSAIPISSGRFSLPTFFNSKKPSTGRRQRRLAYAALNAAVLRIVSMELVVRASG
jgi:hypothetical protein